MFGKKYNTGDKYALTENIQGSVLRDKGDTLIIKENIKGVGFIIRINGMDGLFISNDELKSLSKKKLLTKL